MSEYITPYVYVKKLDDALFYHRLELASISGLVNSYDEQYGYMTCKHSKEIIYNTEAEVLSGNAGCECSIILSNAFQNCVDLKIVDIPNLQYIETSAFAGCINLSVVNLKNVKYVGKDAFLGCNNMSAYANLIVTEIDDNGFYGSTIVNAQFPNVKTIGNNAFCQCTNLTSINVDSVLTIGDNAFDTCCKLSILNIPNAYKAGNKAFYCCTDLQYINILSLNEVLDEQFEFCNNLLCVNINSARNIGYEAFKDCISLKLCFARKTVEIKDNAFLNCKSLEFCSFPSAQKVGKAAFKDCYNLLSIDLSYVSTIANIGLSAFLNCENIKFINFQNIKKSTEIFSNITKLMLFGYNITVLYDNNKYLTLNKQVIPRSDTYTELEYIDTNGKCYVRFDYMPLKNDKILLKWKAFDGSKSEYSGEYAVIIGSSDDILWTHAGIRPGGDTSLQVENFSTSRMSTDDDLNLILNARINLENLHEMALLCLNESKNGFEDNHNKRPMRFFYCQITRNSELIYDFIPVKDQYNIVCMYDKISRTFFYNDGIGTLIAGPDKKI